MIVQFYLKFSSSFGEALFISGNNEELGNNVIEAAFPLTFLNDQYWYGQVNIDDRLEYKYILKDKNGIYIIEGEKDRIITLSESTMAVIDTWNHAGDERNVYYTQPFRDTLLQNNPSIILSEDPGKRYVEFRVKAPLLLPSETICIIGKGGLLGDWETTNPWLLRIENGWYTIQLDLSLEAFPVKYKYGIYNTENKKFSGFESGEDRVLGRELFDKSEVIIIHDGFVQYQKSWKGAGVAIPVFSLRSKKSFGTGEFADLKLLVDWAKITGLKLIQLLPINDTTANHNEHDSYPYAAISAFALNPLYINLDTVASNGGKEILKPYLKKQKQLNGLEDLDYNSVMRFKIAILKELYDVQKNKLSKDQAYLDFVNENVEWLKPYAAFCFLRDKYATADFSKWKYNSVYDAPAIEKLYLTKGNESIKFYYFVQYHLHLQLKEVVNYAHENKIILKGDIPIGVFRNGCDAWMSPDLFHLDQQSGAPPDDFAVKGQNWGFPTYNWPKMQQDGFRWWNLRFAQMKKYFDAFRIDHILGFFRIWSIPLTAVEGILGKFSPAISINISEFYDRNINFDRDRFCKPFITDWILSQEFGENDSFVKTHYLDASSNGTYHFKEVFNTQKKIEKYFLENAGIDEDVYKQKLFDLHSNVILIEDEVSINTEFHFRILMEQTTSFQALDDHSKRQLKELYVNYFYVRQDESWRREAMKKLPILKWGTDMLICGEDLGMVPSCVPAVMNQTGILSLEIQRMPKDPQVEFFHPKDAPYLSVVTPSTHDMSTIRGWWEEDREKTQRFYHFMLGHYGAAPYYCEGWVNKEIVIQHLYSPAMWAIFQLQDLLGMDESLRRQHPDSERINVPANSNHYWRYRMHLFIEDLIKENNFNSVLNDIVVKSGRS